VLDLQARVQPTSHAEIVEYLLDTEGGEMSFEVARTRPMLTDDLFTYLKEQISAYPSQWVSFVTEHWQCLTMRMFTGYSRTSI
jgi:hypothetical protein